MMGLIAIVSLCDDGAFKPRQGLPDALHIKMESRSDLCWRRFR